MLLMGFGVEDLFRAIAAKRGLLMTNPDLYFDGLVAKEKGGRGLTGFARSLRLALSRRKREHFRHLEGIVYWAGRNSVALSQTDSYC